MVGRSALKAGEAPEGSYLCQPGSEVSPTTIRTKPSLPRNFHRLGVAAADAIGEVGFRQERRRRDHHRAELDRGQHDLPQRCDVAERQENPVAAPDAEGAQPVCRLAGAARHLAERRSALHAGRGFHDPQRRAIAAIGSIAEPIEPVDRPVERDRLRPAEAGVGAGVIFAMVEQKLPRLGEGGHRYSLPNVPHSFPRVPRAAVGSVRRCLRSDKQPAWPTASSHRTPLLASTARLDYARRLRKFAQGNAMDWDDFRFFVALARTSTLSAAGSALGVDHTTVGRRIARLEAALKAKLFVRSPLGYELTPAARSLLRAAETMESAAISTGEVASSDTDHAAGVVRIGAPDGVGTLFLARRFGALLQRHPGLEIELLATSRIFNPSRREADIAISLALPPRGRLVGRKLTEYHLGLYASRKYLRAAGGVSSIDDLQKLDVIGYIEDLIYAPELNYLPLISKSLHGRFRSGNLIAQLQAVLVGQGIAVLPKFIAAEYAQLQPVLAQDVRLVRTFYLLLHEDDRNLSRVRTVADFIADEMKKNEHLFKFDE
jgi:DNA-binding transcriptional LysR family regulator